MSQAKVTAIGAPIQPKWLTITGWIITSLMSGVFIMSGVMKLIQHPAVLKGFGEQFKIPLQYVFPIGVVEISCVLLYLFPRTSILGAVLLTGYLGGAIMTHLRVDEYVFAQVIMGIVMWFGIYLREPRLRAIMPIR